MYTFLLFFLSVLPLPISYFLYRRYDIDRQDIGESIDAFLYGVISAAALVVLFPYISGFFSQDNEFLRAFLQASLIEKALAYLALLFLLRRSRDKLSVSEAMSLGIFCGLGFAGMENLFYAYEIRKFDVILRLFSSVPLHITTCAIMAYFLGQFYLTVTMSEKIIHLIRAAVIPILFHTFYDLALLRGDNSTYYIAPVLVILISVQEYLMAKSKTLPGAKELKNRKLGLEDFFIIDKQLEYERWILLSMGKKNVEKVPFFSFRVTKTRQFYIILLTLFGFSYFLYDDFLNETLMMSLRPEEQITLFFLYPLVGAFNLILAKSINPEYFRSSRLSLPVVADVTLKSKKETLELNGSDLNSFCVFVKTLDFMDIGEKKEITFKYSDKISPVLPAEVVWDNHENLFEPIGTLFHIRNSSLEFRKFLIKFNFFRFVRGLIFNLKIPGFESLRNHFVKTITIMEDHSYVTEGTILFEEGDKGSDFYFLKKGKVEIYKVSGDGEKMILAVIEPGNIFGEMSMITGQPRAATAVCLTNCHVSTANADNLEALILNSPEFSLQLMKTFANRISNSEGILMRKIQDLEFENSILKEKNLILEDYIANQTELEKSQVRTERTKTKQTKIKKKSPGDRKTKTSRKKK
ncbi:MAG TPA: cyclic nucleotide-binding domain-containing protein [Leptospiraceae bacterium]|nr:cyclic nucleotide-binding domain-containing protein [Leptospiraceae bacterium]